MLADPCKQIFKMDLKKSAGKLECTHLFIMTSVLLKSLICLDMMWS